ncbi:hypothetical protein C8Q76DRAFT_396314 [Earliella scabrosa]|nr:hypothetical protein C8Q76DRAFT_396314 [Earliella scabrosa]
MHAFPGISYCSLRMFLIVSSPLSSLFLCAHPLLLPYVRCITSVQSISILQIHAGNLSATLGSTFRCVLETDPPVPVLHRRCIRNPVFLQTETDISGASGPTGLILIDPPITGLRRCLQLETCSPSRDAVSVAFLSLSYSRICRIYHY